MLTVLELSSQPGEWGFRTRWVGAVCFGVQIRVWFGIFIWFCFLSSGMVLVCFHMMCFVSASYRCNIILKVWFVKHGFM